MSDTARPREPRPATASGDRTELGTVFTPEGARRLETPAGAGATDNVVNFSRTVRGDGERRGDGESENRPRHEVRAGPGDAGAQDAPRVLPKTRRPKRTRRSWAVLVGLMLLAVLIAWAILGAWSV